MTRLSQLARIMQAAILDIEEDGDPFGDQRWRTAREIPAHIKARADEEWNAMDARGNLPEGWKP